MGLLAENKSRRKISTDPNNTKWTRDTTTFGQKILRSQGWQPGEYLGAKDAPHSEFHTAANASYIKVALKDDMKGLGFKKSKEDEITGLDVFSDVLSRLNGKSDEAIEQDQQARLVVKTSSYVESRWGPMRFVRGGLLVGDELKETSEDNETEGAKESPTAAQQSDADSKAQTKKEKKNKKRKAASLDEEETSGDLEPSADADASQDKKRRKQERKAKKNKAESADDSSASEKDDDTKAKKRAKKEKKEKKDKRDKKRRAELDDATEAGEPMDITNKESTDSPKKRKRSKDVSQDEVKKSKKEKKEKKEKKKRKKEEAEASGSDAVDTAEVSTQTTTVASTGTSTPLGSRNFVRSRFIAQKKQAVLDVKLLNQIFMVKA